MWFTGAPFWSSRWKQKLPFLSFYPELIKLLSLPPLTLQTTPPSIPSPSQPPSSTSLSFAQSECIRQTGCNSAWRWGCLSWILLHISMTRAPVVPRQGDVHINSSHTRQRRGARVEHRWVAGQEERQKDGRREGGWRKGGREEWKVPLPFILGCVIYNIPDTATLKFALRVSPEENSYIMFSR